MEKRRRIGLGLLLTTVLGCLAAWALFPHEPVYHDKKLSQWLEQCKTFDLRWANEDADYTAKHDEAVTAIRAIGTNALPELLARLEARDSPAKQELRSLLSSVPLAQCRLVSSGEKNLYGCIGIEALGPAAKPAIPQIVGFLVADHDANYHPSDIYIQIFVCLEALAAIGPEAVPALRQYVTNKNVVFRAGAAMAFTEMAFAGMKENDAVVGGMLKLLNDKDANVRDNATGFFFYNHSESALPLLSQNLQDPVQSVRSMTATCLSHYGPKAFVALPALRQALADPDWYVRAAVSNAIEKIVNTNTVEALPLRKGKETGRSLTNKQ